MKSDPQGRFIFVGESHTARSTSCVDERSVLLVAKVDPASGALTQVDSKALAGSCVGDITVDPSGRHLYVGIANITTSGGSIQAFSIAPTGTLTELGSPMIVEGPPVSLAMHPSGKFVFAATPSIAVLDRDAATGTLTMRTVFSTPKRQLALNSSGTLLMASERDTNEASQFAVDEAGNISETFADRRQANVRAGVAFDPTGRFVFKTTVADGTVASFVLGRDTGQLTPIGRPIATGGHAVSITVVQPH